MKRSSSRKRQQANYRSVQQEWVYLRETVRDLLCFAFPGSPAPRSYRAVLEVLPINLALKSEEEQEAIIERFGALLKSQTSSLQVLVRNQRLDLAPYIERLLAGPPEELPVPPDWIGLAGSLATMVQRIAAERTLIERHVYVIVPAP